MLASNSLTLDSHSTRRCQGSCLRPFSPRTAEAYLGCMRRYHVFHGRRNPTELVAQHVTALLNSLATHGEAAASTQNQALAALLFVYRDVLGVRLPCSTN